MLPEIHGWKMVAPGRLERFSRRAAPPGPGRALVQVAGCGVCHTDIGYLYDGVPTCKTPPLVLGHEISGVVVAVGGGVRGWTGQRVIVPAVSPCKECHACRTGRRTACSASTMPGNDEDGGFATHVDVPAWSLCGVDGEPSSPEVAFDAPIGRAALALWEVAVVADAVTTPLQAIRRCGLGPGELAVVIGAGGIGMFLVQLAVTRGAEVIALDVDAARLEIAASLGARQALDARGDTKTIRKQIRDEVSRLSLPVSAWHIFEASGTRAGQELAWSLLTSGGSLSVVGFTGEPGTFRLSNLMVCDATAYGNWGCDPALYAEALHHVASGAVELRRLVRRAPLDEAPRILEAVHRGEIRERVVLVP